MHTADTTTTDDPTDAQLSLREIAVATPRISNGTIMLPLSTAIAEAGLEDAKALRFAVDESADRIVAVGLDVAVDGRSDKHARSLQDPQPSQEGPARRVVIPPAVLKAAFDLDADDVESPGVRLRVYASPEGVLVFESAGRIAIDRELLEDLR